MPICQICHAEVPLPCGTVPANDNFPGGPSDPAPDIGMRLPHPANDDCPVFDPANPVSRRIERPSKDEEEAVLSLLPLECFRARDVYWRLAQAFCDLGVANDDERVSQRQTMSWVADSIYIMHRGVFAEMTYRGPRLCRPEHGAFIFVCDYIERVFDKGGRWIADFRKAGRQIRPPLQKSQERVLGRLQLIEASLAVRGIPW